MVPCFGPRVFRPCSRGGDDGVACFGVSALIVWLNDAAWLHMRLMQGLHGTVAARWARVGLAVTTFALPAADMVLSGLHPCGEL